MNIQLRRKQGNYKLYKLPNGAVMLPNYKGIRLGDMIKLSGNGSYLDSIYSLGRNDFIVVNCDKNYCYKINGVELNKLFEFNSGDSIIDGISKHRKDIDRAFGVLYLTHRLSDNYIINGARIQLKKEYTLNKKTVSIEENKFRSVNIDVDGIKYDLDRLIAEFDNRGIPKEWRLKLNNDSLKIDSYLSTLLESNTYDFGGSILFAIRRFINDRYDQSILKYYNIGKPELDNGKIIYNSLENMEFYVHMGRDNTASLYRKNGLKKEMIIKECDYTQFSRTFENLFALGNKRTIYSLIPGRVSLCAVQLLEEYKADSGMLNKVIRKAFNDEEISSNEIEYYIKAIYLYKLLLKCKSDRTFIVYRGNIHRDDTYTFKSASFSFPVALYHGKERKDTAVIQCKTGTNMMLSNYTQSYGHEAEVIINAGWSLQGDKNKNQMARLKAIKTKDTLELKEDARVKIANALIYDDFIKNYLYIGNINKSRINLVWINDIKIRKSYIEIKNDKALFVGDNIHYEFELDKIEVFLSILRNYIKYCIDHGMQYRTDCDLHRIMAMNVQAILFNMGIAVDVESGRGISSIKAGNNKIDIIESFYIEIKNTNGVQLLTSGRNMLCRKDMVDIDDTIHKCCLYILRNYKLDYLGYVENLLGLIDRVSDFEVHKYSDKLMIEHKNNYISIYDKDKGIELKNDYGKVLKKLEFTFDEIKDAKSLYDIITSN